MKFYEFGDSGNPAIMCLPGNFMTHRQFENIVPMLEPEYHVITVSFDGYDETGETVYTTGEDQARKLADYIRNHLGGKIDLVYAESLGSIPAVFLTRMEGLQIGGIIVSGAEYMNYGIFNSMAIKLFVPMLKQACQTLTLETTEATFWEALKLYPEHVSTWEPNPNIRISCWYGEKEMNMKKAIQHLKRAFPNLEEHPFKGLGHGEIMAHPELLVQELKAFLGR